LAQFERLVQRRTLQSYFWARFAQPTRVVFAASPAVQERVTRALATAVATTARETVPLLHPGAVRNDLWARAFYEAYRTELRAERPERGGALYETFAERYDAITRLLCAPEFSSKVLSPEARRRAARKWLR